MAEMKPCPLKPSAWIMRDWSAGKIDVTINPDERDAWERRGAQIEPLYARPAETPPLSQEGLRAPSAHVQREMNNEPSPFARELLEALRPFADAWDVAVSRGKGLTLGELSWLAKHHTDSTAYKAASALITKANSRGKGECTQRDGFANCNFTRTNRLDACHEPGGCLASPPTSKGEG